MSPEFRWRRYDESAGNSGVEGRVKIELHVGLGFRGLGVKGIGCL